jgi:replicative DNA helicase
VTDWVFESEVRVLGQALAHSETAPRVFDLIADRLSADDFATKPHGDAYAAMAALTEDREPITLPGILRRLREWKRPERETGPALGLVVEHGFPRLADRTVLAHVRYIRQASRIRRTRQLGAEIVNAKGDGAEVEAVLAGAHDTLSRLALESLDEPDEDTVGTLEAAGQALLRAGEADASVLRTGLVDVDRVFTAGLGPRTLTVLAALTSRGKTSLAMQFGDALAAQLAASGARGVIRVFSLEMGELELDKRRLIAASGVPLEVWEGRAPARGDERDRLARALAELKRRPLRIMYGGGISAEQVRAVARRDAETRGLALVIVDYLQALEAAKGDETREREVARMARTLKGLSLDLDVPVLALAQLNRTADATERPSLSHLRESGTIEQYADNVLFLYQKQKDPANVVTLRVGKQRNGARDTEAKVLFRGELFRFENLADDGSGQWWNRT